MAYPILGTPVPAFFDTAGAPLASGTISILDPADDTVKASYPTADDADASTNGTSGDITLDSRGEPTSTQLWGRDSEDYKIVIKDSAASTVLTMDDIRMPENSRRAAVTFTSTDATPSIANGSHFITAGTTQITDFDDGQVGDVIHVRCGASDISIKRNAAHMIIKDGLDFNMQYQDTITLAMFNDQVWWEIGRSRGTPRYEVVQAFTNTLTAAETGKTFFLDLVGGGSTVLPAPALGLNFKFIVSTAPTTAYTIDTNGGDNIMHGTHIDIVGELVYATARDIITFVASTSLVGDSVELVSDGTSWFFTAQSGADGGITTGQT